jgi:AraC-like DNA-binding protein
MLREGIEFRGRLRDNTAMARRRSARSLLEQIARQPVRYVAGWTVRTVPDYCRPHSHAAYEIVYHRKGRGCTTLYPTDQQLDFDCDSVIIYPPGAVHDQHCRTVGEDVCVLLAPARSTGPRLHEACHIPTVVDLYLVRELVSLANVPVASGTLARTALDRRATALWTSLLQPLIDQADPDPQAGGYAHQARRYIQQHYRSIRSVPDVARALGLSPDHLRHLYREACHTTIQADLNRARLEDAANLIQHSRLPLKAVAAQSGFASASYLCVAFREHFGCTPGRFRYSAAGRKLRAR